MTPISWAHLTALAAVLLATPPARSADVVPGEGIATHYDSTGDGNCSFVGPPADRLDVALSHVEYGTADSCGGYLDVTGPNGTVRVKITNQCPECEQHHLDLSQTAFARIAPLDDGRVPVSYTLVRNPPLAEPIAIRVKNGSSRWWLQIQALDHGNPLARFELQTSAGWRSLVHTGDNFWMAENPGPGDGPFTVRITDIHGQSVTIPGIALTPDQVQRTTARLYGAGAPPPPPPPSSTPVAPPTTTVAPTSTSPPTTTTTSPARPAARADGSETAAGSVDPSDDSSTAAIVVASVTFALLAAAAFVVRRRSSA